MKNNLKTEFYETINEFKRIILINKSRIPKYFLDGDYSSNSINNLDKDVYNDNLLCTKHINFLEKFGKFINKYEIDNTQIKKPILDKIKEYCRLKRSPKKIVFSEEEDNIYEDSEDEDSEDDNSDNEESIINTELNEPNKSNESIINTEPNESIINNESNESIIYDLLKKVGNVLEKLTINNNVELIKNSLKTVNTLATIIFLKKESNTDNTLLKQSNADNTLVKQSSIDNTEQSSIDNTENSNIHNTEKPNIHNTEQSNIDNTEQSNIDNTLATLPKWLKNLKCIINPLNNVKKDNKSFQYSVALSKHKEWDQITIE